MMYHGCMWRHHWLMVDAEMIINDNATVSLVNIVEVCTHCGQRRLLNMVSS